VCHCESQAQAVALKQALEARMNEVGLELHLEKTRIVY
jgi:RNA-directed DNA polymerase